MLVFFYVLFNVLENCIGRYVVESKKTGYLTGVTAHFH